jgi:abequosyltransferase
MGEWHPSVRECRLSVPSPVILSVCIPVYNCGDYLPFALDSILAQAGDGVEVIVYDGASTDDTPQVMQRYARPGLVYHRAPAKGGIDADMAACVALAQGDHCWLFSGDDVMRPGALARALEFVRGDADVLLCRHTICDIAMRVREDYDVLRPADVGAEAQLADPAQRLAWFTRAATSEAFFSFMSGIVVRKAAWDRGRTNPAFANSCWAHVERLLALGLHGLRVRYVPEIWLDQRGGNDSFVRAGVVNRYRIAIEGLQRIAESLFGRDSPEAFHVRRVLRFEFTLPMFLNTKILCHEHPEREDRALLDSLYARLHSDRSFGSLLLLAAYHLTPVPIAYSLRWSVRTLRRMRGG